MGHIKEPKGVDLIVNPMPLTIEDRQAISTIIANYKRTGEVPKTGQKSKILGKQKPVAIKGKATKGKSSVAKKVIVA